MRRFLTALCAFLIASPALAQGVDPIARGLAASGGSPKATGSTTARTAAARFAQLVNVEDYGAVENGTTDDSGALSSAIAAANALMSAGTPACVYIPTGTLYLNGSTTIPQFTTGYPGCVKGEGSEHSVIKLGTSFSGSVFQWSDAWVVNTEGPHVEGLTITGQVSASNTQNALMFYDRDDYIYVNDVNITGLHGQCLVMGVEKNTSSAYTRESRVNNLRCWNAGTSTLPVIQIDSAGSTGDATNEVRFNQIDIYGSNGTSLLIENLGTASAVRDLTFTKLRVEGTGGGTTAAPLVQVGSTASTGGVDQITFNDIELIDPYTSYPAFLLTGNGSSIPYLIHVDGFIGGGQSNGSGVDVEYGRNSDFHFLNVVASGTNFKTASTSGSGLVFDTGTFPLSNFTTNIWSPYNIAVPAMLSGTTMLEALGSGTFGIGNVNHGIILQTIDASATTSQPFVFRGGTNGSLPNIITAGINPNIIAVTGNFIFKTGGVATGGPGGTSEFGINTDGSVQMLNPLTVATLPTCSASTAGEIAFVTDATSPTYNGALTGGSNVGTLALCRSSGGTYAWAAH